MEVVSFGERWPQAQGCLSTFTLTWKSFRSPRSLFQTSLRGLGWGGSQLATFQPVFSPLQPNTTARESLKSPQSRG